MKYKTKALVALISVMGVFLFHSAVFAASSEDKVAPTVSAAVAGDLLRVSASDDSSGVDAVFINGRRVNYRVDGAVDLPLTEYAGEDEWISIYAEDFAGNISDTVTIRNPLFNPPEQTPKLIPGSDEDAATDNGLRPFTPAGTGTVMDNPTDGDGKEFFTITTPDGNVFFLIIDRQRNVDDVYLLNAVTEQDLMALARSNGSPGYSAIPDDPIQTRAPEPSAEPIPEPEPPEKKGGSGSMIFIIIAAIAAGGAGYYFKILLPKRQAPDDGDEDYEDESDEGDGEMYDDSDDDTGTQATSVDDGLIGLDFIPDETRRMEE